ncbi:GGDEF domain-containing protein [Pararhodospirillum photometricum]|nr:GGDEF domain-containing protein [Pararhodospirillum photometricum]
MWDMEGLFFGKSTFEEGEEYLRFKFRLLYAIVYCGFFLTALFLSTVHAGLIEFDPVFLRFHWFFLLSTLVMAIVLRGRRQWMFPVAWYYAVLAFANYVMAFFFNVMDEMRVVWFFLNIPAVHLILGPLAGTVTAAASIAFILLANPLLDQPYSLNGQMTMIIAILYITAFIHAFTAKSISFHHAMVEANQRLHALATRDPLTDLLNSRTYYALGERLLRASQRGGRPCCVLFIDLDHFKRINDQYGHEAGDDVLKTVAGTLRRSVRASDLVGRIGGEEFSLLLPDTALAGALDLGESLRRDIEALRIPTGSLVLGVTASIGVAESTSGQSLAEIQRHADEAMYVAKREGRNRVTTLATGHDTPRLVG